MPSGAATMHTRRMCRAPARVSMSQRGHGAAAGRQHRIDHQHVAVRRAAAAASRSTATRPRSVRRAAGRCGRRARRARAPACRAACPSPARSTGTSTTSALHACPRAGPSGVVTVSGTVGRSRSASAAEQHADAAGELAKSLGRRAHVAQLQQDVLNERMSDEVNHGAELTRRVQFRQCRSSHDAACSRRLHRVWPLVLVARRASLAAQAPRRGRSRDRQRHRRHDGRSAARAQPRVGGDRGPTIVGRRDAADQIASRLQGARHDRRRRPRRHARV